jgi:hypothetical protein
LGVQTHHCRIRISGLKKCQPSTDTTAPRAQHRASDVFRCSADRTAPANFCGIALSGRSNLLQTVHRQLVTITRRRLLQSSSGKRVAFINTTGHQETQWQWRNRE